MNNRTILAGALGLVLVAAVIPGTAAAQLIPIEGLDLNLALQVFAAGADTSETVSNDAEVYMTDVGGAAASANCQWAFGYNVHAISISAVDGFGLISDEDWLKLEGGLRVIRPLDIRAEDDVELDTQNADASCDQSVGTIRIVDASSGDWGAVAPQGAALNGAATALGGSGFGTSGLNANLQVAVAGATVDDTVVNDYYLDMSDSGGTLAAANCQWVVGVNVVAASLSLIKAKSTIEDDDSTKIDLDEQPTNGPIEAAGIESEEGQVTDDSEYATASCIQSVDLIEIIIGGNGSIRPES